MFNDDSLDFFIENSNDLIYTLNLENKKISFNSKFKEKLNLKKITHLEDFLKLFIKEKHKEKFLKLLNEEKLEENKLNYILKNEKQKELFIKNIIHKKQNLIIGICKIKKINKYKRLFQVSKIPVLLIEASTQKIIKANDCAIKFYGYTSKELRKLKISDINTLSKEQIQVEINKVRRKEKECFNFKHKTKAGKIIDVEVYSGSLNYKNKKLIYSAIFDITKRKNAQKKLQQAHTIYQNTKEGIFITDLKANILSINKAFEEITEYSEKEVIYKNPNILKSNRHSEVFYQNIWSELKKNGIWEGEIINKTKTGKIFPQWLTINTVFDEEKKPMNYIAVFTDISKLKEQELLLREKDQIMFQQSKMASMGEMLRNIAHQWRQPLSVITSSATGLKLKQEFGLLSDGDFEEFAQGILKSATYLSETIEDFSNYFKNYKDSEEFLLNDVLEKTVQLTQASIKNYDVDFELKMQNDELKIYGIKNELIQIFINLINNSIDAFKNQDIKQKQIHIETLESNNQVIIILEDNAGGVSSKIIEKIFEPYFTTKHQSQGTGIGLYMSKQIIEEKLKGCITAKNIQKNIEGDIYKGIQFKLTIPLSKAIS